MLVCLAADYHDPEAYARRVLITTYVSGLRRRWSGELPSDWLPDGGTPDTTEEIASRLTLRQALGRLPHRQRALVVQRYFEDLSEVQTAEAMRVSVGTVRARPVARWLGCGPTQTPSQTSTHPESWIPGYLAVKERDYQYELRVRETTSVEFSFRLDSTADAVLITMDHTSTFGTFLHCNLQVNGDKLGRCGDVLTRAEYLQVRSDYGPAWDCPKVLIDPSSLPTGMSPDEMAKQLVEQGWADLGVEPGDMVRVSYEIEYVTAGPEGPPQDSGTLTVGVYQPAGG